MRIAFLQNLWHEYLGVIYIASLLKSRGHEPQVFIAGGENDLVRSVVDYEPDIIAFPVTSGNHKWPIETAKKIKEKLEVISVFGGPHATFFPEMIEEDSVDIICVGEGEYAMLELCEALEKGSDYSKIKNLWVKDEANIVKNVVRPLIEDLDELPFPDRSLYFKYGFLRDLETKTFITGRGCPYDCTFCFNHVYKKVYSGCGRYVRKRGVDGVLAEIFQVRRDYGLETIFFADDTFIIDKKWLKEFLERFKTEVNLPFFCGVRADLVDEDTVKLLSEAGCYMVTVGIESGNEFIRNKILKKQLSNKQILGACSLFHKYGIKIRSTNIFSIPEETLDRALETVELNILAGIDYPFSSLLQPYPKTEIAKYAKNNGFLKEDFSLDDLSTLYFDTNVINISDKRSVSNLHRLFYLAVKFPALLPLIKRLVHLPLEPVYRIVFMICFTHNYAKYKRLNVYRVLKLGWLTLKNKIRY